MDHQQRLFIILGTVILVLAINGCGSNVDNANIEAVRRDINAIAAAAQGYYMKPEMMGGGSNSFAGLSWKTIETIPCNTESRNGTIDYMNCVNKKGTFTMSISGDTLTITAYPSSFEEYQADQTNSKSISAKVTADTLLWVDLITGSPALND